MDIFHCNIRFTRWHLILFPIFDRRHPSNRDFFQKDELFFLRWLLYIYVFKFAVIFSPNGLIVYTESACRYHHLRAAPCLRWRFIGYTIHNLSSTSCYILMCLFIWQCITRCEPCQHCIALKSYPYIRCSYNETHRAPIKWSNTDVVSTMINNVHHSTTIRRLGRRLYVQLLMFESRFQWIPNIRRLSQTRARLIKRLFRWVIERVRDSPWTTWINWLRSRQWFMVSRCSRWFYRRESLDHPRDHSEKKWLVSDSSGLWTQHLIVGRRLFVCSLVLL